MGGRAVVIFVSYTSSASWIRISAARQDGLRYGLGKIRFPVSEYVVKRGYPCFEKDAFGNHPGVGEGRGERGLVKIGIDGGVVP